VEIVKVIMVAEQVADQIIAVKHLSVRVVGLLLAGLVGAAAVVKHQETL
jgi:hypothetical protein